MSYCKVTIQEVLEGSIADELEIEKGDKLLSINGEAVGDILEYKYLISDEVLVLEIEKPDGEIWELEIIYIALAYCLRSWACCLGEL